MSVIKLVTNAATVLTCRELLILATNFSLKQKEKEKENQEASHQKNKLTLFKLNCETEFEFLLLLDILYHTDNSYKYKLFVKNLINVLISVEGGGENKNEDGKEEEEQSLSEKSDKKNKILASIVTMACDFMLPEFKQMEKVTWSSENTQSNDSDSIKVKVNNDPMVEDSINFSLFGGAGVAYQSTTTGNNKQSSESVDGLSTNGQNLNIIQTARPNDIEKISKQSDNSNLLILFDTSKQKNNSLNLNALKSVKLKRNKLRKLVKSTVNPKPIVEETVTPKYMMNDEFETASQKLDKNICLGEQVDDYLDLFDDTESVDSLRILSNKKSSVATDDSHFRDEVPFVKKDIYLDENDSSDDQDESRKNSAGVAKKNDRESSLSKRCSSIQFQVVSSKKKEQMMSFDNEEYDTEDNQDNDGDEDDDEDDDDTDENSDRNTDEERDEQSDEDEDETHHNNRHSSDESSDSNSQIACLGNFRI